MFLSGVGKIFLLGAALAPNAQASRTLALSRRSVSTGTSLVTAGTYGSTFDVDVTFGNQTFQLLVDTGSSDTYVVKTGFTCVNRTSNQDIAREDCLYANKTYDFSNTFRKVPDQNFGIQYGAGIASGIMGYEDITVGGITVKNQPVGIADRSHPMGDYINSGVLGLAYPAITSAHPGESQNNATYWYNRAIYNPVAFNMHEQGLIDSYFSLVLARIPQNQASGFGGYLTLGGVPPVAHSSNWSVLPVELTKALPLNITSGQSVRSYWTITVSSVTFGREGESTSTNSTPFQAFLDNGNFLSFLPSAVANPINALFDPPAIYNKDLSAYIVDCSATPPKFGLQLGSQVFFHNGSDMIYQTPEGICISSLGNSESISIGGISINILGAPLYKNAVIAHDFGKNELRIAALTGEVTSTSNTSQHTPQPTSQPTSQSNLGSGASKLILASPAIMLFISVLPIVLLI